MTSTVVDLPRPPEATRVAQRRHRATTDQFVGRLMPEDVGELERIRARIIVDLGGEDTLSVLELLLVDSLALVGLAIRALKDEVRAGRGIDLAALVLINNMATKVGGRLGLKRRVREVLGMPSLSEYLAQRQEAAE